MPGPRKILVAQTKGGVGKTTTVIAIASYFVSQGMRVALVDTDPSGNATQWSESFGRVQAIHEPVMDIAAWRALVWSLPADLAVIDTPPRMDRNLGATVALSDLVLVPVGISDWEQQGAADVAAIATAANAARPVPLRIALVPTRVDLRLREGKTLIGDLEQLGLPVAPELGQRILHARAATEGVSLLEAAPWSSAANEVLRLGEWVFKFGGLK